MVERIASLFSVEGGEFKIAEPFTNTEWLIFHDGAHAAQSYVALAVEQGSVA